MHRIAFAARLSAVLVLVLGCHKHHAPKAAAAPMAASQGDPGLPPSSGAAEGPGTCSASCDHYLQCKSMFSPSARSTCVVKCGQMVLSRDQLLQFEGADCATAIQVVEHPRGNGAGNAGNGSGSPQSTSECAGCVWDGSSCMWYSQSDWGPGAYSGAATSCDASCCAGR